MPIVNCIETRKAILNNDPISDTLHVIVVVSNPCQYKRRYFLAREFIQRMELEKNVTLYIVELAYGDQGFHLTEEANPRHLQLRASVPLWHKENMINVGVAKLLPPDWKAFAWIDADIEFESTTWAIDTLKVLNGTRDIVQIFSYSVDMNNKNNGLLLREGIGFKYCNNHTRIHWDALNTTMQKGHPGYAWAISRAAYDSIGGLYENNIIGGGDNIMVFSCLFKFSYPYTQLGSNDHRASVLEFETRAKKLNLGYIPGVIYHYFHGSILNRKYTERHEILLNNNYSPSLHLTKNTDGILIPTDKCPQSLLDGIMTYFSERNEDEDFPSAT
jgi:hypothetical protein